MVFILSAFDLDCLFWTSGVAQNDEIEFFFFFLNHPPKKKQTINWLVPLKKIPLLTVKQKMS